MFVNWERKSKRAKYFQHALKAALHCSCFVNEGIVSCKAVHGAVEVQASGLDSGIQSWYNVLICDCSKGRYQVVWR